MATKTNTAKKTTAKAAPAKKTATAAKKKTTAAAKKPAAKPAAKKSTAAAKSSASTKARKAPVRKTPIVKRITNESISYRAYEIYLRRMREGIPGSPESDWYQAEQELLKG